MEVCTAESCREIIIFTCKFWMLQFGVRHFELTNDSSLFQRMKNQVATDMECVQCYLDGAFVFSVSPNEHLERLSQVFLAIGRHGFKVRMPKYFFAQVTLSLLGDIVDSSGVQIAPLLKPVSACLSVCLTVRQSVCRYTPRDWLEIQTADFQSIKTVCKKKFAKSQR